MVTKKLTKITGGNNTAENICVKINKLFLSKRYNNTDHSEDCCKSYQSPCASD